MDNKTVNFINTAKQTVESIYKGKPLRLYQNSPTCIFPDSYINDATCRTAGFLAAPLETGCDIAHREYNLIIRMDGVAVVTGSYYVLRHEKSGRRQKDLFFTTFVMKASHGRADIIHLHISKASADRFYLLEDTSEHRFRIHESEILYLEAGHNRILWHCGSIRIETAGSFKKIGETLSEEFVRIHRSFIVNRRHASIIARCYVELDNGERLQIPVKKYCEVKRRLLDAAGEYMKRKEPV